VGGGQPRLGKVVALLHANRDVSFVCMRAPASTSSSAAAPGGSSASVVSTAAARSHKGPAAGCLLRTLMQPLDRTAPKLNVLIGAHDLPNTSKSSRHLYLVRWSGWEAGCATPRGVLIKVLPVLESINAGLEAILQPHGLSLQHALTRKTATSVAVPKDASAATEGWGPVAPAVGGGTEGGGPASVDPYCEALKDFPASWTIPWSVRRQRQASSATHVPPQARVVTIDSDGSLDLDDALSVVRLANGNLQVGIHISDVSYFVEPGSRLNALAANRATSIYLASGEILPMLPPRLANNLCSLLPGQERLCVSVSFEVTRSGRLVRDLGAARTVVRSSCRLTYAQADLLLAHGAAAAPVTHTHRHAHTHYGHFCYLCYQPHVNTFSETNPKFKITFHMSISIYLSIYL